MKSSKTLLAGAALLVSLTAHAQAAPNVVTSIAPVHSLVAAVMEGVGTPHLIVEGGASPHTYALKPSQARELANADLVFWVGEDLEAFLAKPISTIAERAKAIELIEAEGLVTHGFREGGAFEGHDHDDHDDHHKDEDHKDGHDHDDHAEAGKDHGSDDDHHKDEDHKDGHDHDHDDHAKASEDHDGHAHDDHHDGTDPHVWLDPENAKAMVRAIAASLSAADAENAAVYSKNAGLVIARLDALSKEISAGLKPVSGKRFIVFHDAYQYFEKRFGLKSAGSISISPETMPGAERIREMRKKVADAHAVCVFSEPQFEPRIVSVVTEGTAAKSAELDPLGASLETGPGHYFSLIRALASSFRKCLGGAG